MAAHATHGLKRTSWAHCVAQGVLYHRPICTFSCVYAGGRAMFDGEGRKMLYFRTTEISATALKNIFQGR